VVVPPPQVYPATYGCINYGINDCPSTVIHDGPPCYPTAPVQHFPPPVNPSFEYTQPLEYSHSQGIPVGEAPPPYSETYTESQGVSIANQ